MLKIKFQVVELVFRTWPKLLHKPYFHSIMNKAFAQYQLQVVRGY